jgi:hypothetical protein
LISENDDTKNLFDNKYILLFIIIVISIASFYGGTYYSNLFNNYEERYTAIIEEMEQDLLYQNITITSLNNNIIELNEKLSKYNQINETYKNLEENYIELIIEYNQLDSETEKLRTELRQFKETQNIGGYNIRIVVANMSFTLSQRYVAYASGLYEQTATEDSGILTASTTDDNTIISFSWDTLESEPNLRATLDNAYSSIGLILEHKMYLTTVIEDQAILYSTFKTVLENKYTYINVATWHDSTSQRRYICIVQNTVDNVTNTLREFLTGFSEIY